jgi:hypothetical protein
MSLAFPVPSTLNGQVIFSRRVYQQQGQTYQQIWSWDPASSVLKALTTSPRNHFRPVCSAGKISFVSYLQAVGEDPQMWSLDRGTGEEHRIGPAPVPNFDPKQKKAGCAFYAQTGTLEACGNDTDLALSRAGRPIGHLTIRSNECPSGKCITPIWQLEWSPDAKWLLVGQQGIDSHQIDYYVVNVASLKISKVGSAPDYAVLWLPGSNRLLYNTPETLEPLPGSQGKHSVWVQQLNVFDPETGKSTAITSGLSNSLDASSVHAD